MAVSSDVRKARARVTKVIAQMGLSKGRLDVGAFGPSFAEGDYIIRWEDDVSFEIQLRNDNLIPKLAERLQRAGAKIDDTYYKVAGEMPLSPLQFKVPDDE
jgi:hypothetical protein